MAPDRAVVAQALLPVLAGAASSTFAQPRVAVLLQPGPLRFAECAAVARAMADEIDKTEGRPEDWTASSRGVTVM